MSRAGDESHKRREPWLQPGGTSFLKQQAKELVKEPTKKVPER